MTKLKRGTLYTVLKTALYRIISMTGSYIIAYLVLGNAGQAGLITAINFVFHTLMYFGYERLSVVVEEKIFYKKDET
jgi:uncharacterized membrane protein